MKFGRLRFIQFSAVVALLGFSGCSSPQKPTPTPVATAPTATVVVSPTLPPSPVASPSPTAEEEKEKQMKKLADNLERIRIEGAKNQEKNELEFQKDKYCLAQRALAEYKKPISPQCKKRLAEFDKRQAERALKDRQAPDDSWLEESNR
ncbi:MAG: hypothetical protein AB1861_05080 [Cyanobacteriota bacterium]